MTDMEGGPAPHAASDEEIMAAVPHSTGGREARVGLFVLLGLVSFVIVLFWMTDPATLRGRYILVTSVDHAGGVRAGDPVQMQGVNVGRVHDFDMVGPGRVNITLEIEGEWQIPRGSRTVMGGSGLFGGRTIEIETTDADTYYEEGDTLPGEGASGSGLLGSVDELSGSAGTVLERLEALLSRETVGSVRGSAHELEQLLTNLSEVIGEQREAIDSLMGSLNRSAAGFEEAAAAGPDVASAAARADSAMALLTVTSRNLDAATTSLRTVLTRMENGEGTLGRLSTDETLYVNLNTAAESLAALIQDLQANPTRYINLSIF